MRSLLSEVAIPHTGAGEDLDAARAVVRKKSFALVSALAFVGTPAIKKLGPASDTEPGLHALAFNGHLGKKSRAYLKQWIADQSHGREILVVVQHWVL